MIFPLSVHNPFLKAAKLFATKISGALAVYIGSVEGFEDEKKCASAKQSYSGKESSPEITGCYTQILLFPARSHLYSTKAGARQNLGSLIKKKGEKENKTQLISSTHFPKVLSEALLAELHFMSITNPFLYPF